MGRRQVPQHGGLETEMPPLPQKNNNESHQPVTVTLNGRRTGGAGMCACVCVCEPVGLSWLTGLCVHV